MSFILILVHIVVCIALIMIVLLQTGKGADMGAAFGGGSSQTLFGSTGASTFLSKATTVAAVVFMLTSLSLAYMSGHKTGGSVVMDAKIPETKPVEQPVVSDNTAKPLGSDTTSSEEKTTGTVKVAEPETASQPAEPVQGEPAAGSQPAEVVTPASTTGEQPVEVTPETEEKPVVNPAESSATDKPTAETVQPESAVKENSQNQ